MPLPACKLCMLPAQLETSHIIPAWAFRFVIERGARTGPQQPVFIRSGAAGFSQEQPQEPLLCRVCEDHFSGCEGYAKSLVAQPDGTFPLSSRLALEDESLDFESLARFGASVFWRASVSASFPKTRLGPYEEAFRKYLLVDAAFPSEAALLVTVLEPPEEIRALTGLLSDIASTKGAGFHQHALTVRGVIFVLLVGGCVPAVDRARCFVRTKHVSRSDGRELFESIAARAQRAVPRGGLARS